MRVSTGGCRPAPRASSRASARQLPPRLRRGCRRGSSPAFTIVAAPWAAHARRRPRIAARGWSRNGEERLTSPHRPAVPSLACSACISATRRSCLAILRAVRVLDVEQRAIELARDPSSFLVPFCTPALSLTAGAEALAHRNRAALRGTPSGRGSDRGAAAPRQGCARCASRTRASSSNAGIASLHTPLRARYCRPKQVDQSQELADLCP